MMTSDRSKFRLSVTRIPYAILELKKLDAREVTSFTVQFLIITSSDLLIVIPEIYESVAVIFWMVTF